MAGQQIAASIDKNGTPQPRQFNLAVKSMFQSICAIFPQRAMFNLMCQWSRQLKFHFQRDAINVLAVLCYQLNMDLPTFLLTAQCWRILPVSTKDGKARRQRARIKYIQNSANANNLVNNLHTSVEMLNYDIINEEHLYMSAHWMYSVNRPKIKLTFYSNRWTMRLMRYVCCSCLFCLCKIKHCHQMIIYSHTLSFYNSLFIFETLLS